jgi:excisionase family DNA binding protein
MTHVRQPEAHRETGEQPISPPFFLTVKEAADLLRVSEITLSRWRLEGCGPPFRKFGRRVLYARCDVLAWADARQRWSTSEASASGEKR